MDRVVTKSRRRSSSNATAPLLFTLRLTPTPTPTRTYTLTTSSSSPRAPPRPPSTRGSGTRQRSPWGLRPSPAPFTVRERCRVKARRGRDRNLTLGVGLSSSCASLHTGGLSGAAASKSTSPQGFLSSRPGCRSPSSVSPFPCPTCSGDQRGRFLLAPHHHGAPAGSRYHTHGSRQVRPFGHCRISASYPPQPRL